MQTTVNVVCYKSKTLANGEHPLMIRLCQGRKLKYLSLGISILPQFWDFDKNKPRRNCPNKELINNLITEKTKEFSNQIIEFKSESKDFTVTKLVEVVVGGNSIQTVSDFLHSEIDRLYNEGRLKYASTFKELRASLLEFNKHLDVYFSDIDINWLKQYESFLRNKGLGDNSIGVRFRTFRVLYNRAITENIVKADYYPFRIYKVSKLKKETVKRSITKTDVEQIINYKVDREYTQLAIDLFYFSYLSGGINFVDMAYLTRDNIIDTRLVYTRKKTKKLIKLPIQDKALFIVEKYHSDNAYLFPILSAFHKTAQQKANRVNKVLRIINKSLKEIGEELELPIDITTYVARHTYATVLKRSGVNTSIISESLGHSSEKITQIYLDSFENSQIDEAMKNLL
ncbi:site-specific integrase [Dysgonomonas capnocytophagoides]|uniref:site-specific integrase n=1 Tax=Dysgonomonas capnocytophagoides TaxID=45254 RepID=UPI000426C4A2|nr:site-specific integrase [Dysgonomonas capnocytophagoides]